MRVPTTALYDANVLYPSFLRDLLIRLARTGVVQARWSGRIHEEWIRSLAANRPDIPPDRLLQLRDLIDAAVPDCRVEGYEAWIDSLTLPDPDDRHVLAAAIEGSAEVIVTFNVDDFPSSALEPFGIAARVPEQFLSDLYGASPGSVVAAVREHRSALRRPGYSPEEYLQRLRMDRLGMLAYRLEADGVEL